MRDSDGHDEKVAFEKKENIEKYFRIVDKFLRNIILRKIFKSNLNEKM